MGLEMSYQAIPPGSGLIELARKEPELGELLSHVPRWFRDDFRRGLRPWPEAERLLQILKELESQHPGLAKRNCFLDHQWDAMHYVLSGNRREEPGSEVDALFDKAVLGDWEIAEHVQGAQGAPVKFVTPEDVNSIAYFLEPITCDFLHRQLNLEKMTGNGVYKFQRSWFSDGTWDTHFFQPFRAFYLDAARHGECVLVCLD